MWPPPGRCWVLKSGPRSAFPPWSERMNDIAISRALWKLSGMRIVRGKRVGWTKHLRACTAFLMFVGACILLACHPDFEWADLRHVHAAGNVQHWLQMLSAVLFLVQSHVDVGGLPLPEVSVLAAQLQQLVVAPRLHHSPVLQVHNLHNLHQNRITSVVELASPYLHPQHVEREAL